MMPSILLKLVFNRYTGVFILVLSIWLGGKYIINDVHYNPLAEKSKRIIILDNNLTTCSAEKEKLISDMSVVYDNGYNTGWKGGFSYEKSNIATIHSVNLPF